jgi:hypothetical protein
MATNPSTLAENIGRITAVTAAYPYGSAKDDSTGTTGDGTPIKEAVMNDTYGLQQAILRAAGITPSGNADTALASQYLQGIVEVAAGRAVQYDGSGAADVYVASVKTNQQAPGDYFDGMVVQFTAGTPNTGGAVTVNVAGLGVVSAKMWGGSTNPSEGLITATDPTQFVYRSLPSAHFEWLPILTASVFRTLKSESLNLLINGAKLINQRNFAGGQPAAGVYGFDRWKGDAAGTRIEQVIENTVTLGGVYTISWAGGTGTADVDGTTGLSSGDSVTMTATGNYSVIVPTDADEIKFERGSVATPYDARPRGAELALCQRYYETGGSDITEVQSGSNGSGVNSQFRNEFAYLVEKRDTGTLSFSSATLAASKVTSTNSLGANINNNLTGTPVLKTRGFQMRAQIGTGAGYKFYWNVDSEL